MRKLKSYCQGCGGWHKPEDRQALIRRLGKDFTASVVRGHYGDHIWPRTVAGDRMLWRDMAVVRGYSKGWDPADSEVRLQRFLHLVLERGVAAHKAETIAHIDRERGSRALRSRGYEYKNRGRWGNSGWFRRRAA